MRIYKMKESKDTHTLSCEVNLEPIKIGGEGFGGKSEDELLRELYDDGWAQYNLIVNDYNLIVNIDHIPHNNTHSGSFYKFRDYILMNIKKDKLKEFLR